MRWRRLTWRRLRRVARRLASLRSRIRRRIFLWRVALHRRRLRQVTFVAITGSMGKTTTRDLVSAVLATLGPVNRSYGRSNLVADNARLVLAGRPIDRYCVVETPTARPGYLAQSVRFVRPDIGIVTNVSTDHRSKFGSVEAIAAEKSHLVRALPPNGVAILNVDDPRVLAMRSLFAGRVVTFGRSAEADVRGEDIRSAWPERLSLTARFGSEEVRVQTRLCGAHLAPVVLAALAAGVAEGLPLVAAAEAVGRVEPNPGRMSVVTHDDGVTFIRDDHKAPLPSIAPALDFLRTAEARRKIAVIGTISDYPGNARAPYVRVARAAAEVADLVIFSGPRASSALRARRDPSDPILAFHTVQQVSRYLDGVLQAGDLVLLKGSNAADHLVRIPLARTRTVRCWRGRCGKKIHCDGCRLLAVAAGDGQAATDGREPIASDAERPVSGIAATTEVPEEERHLPAEAAVVVGLGNPGSQYEDTPHNVGQAAVDVLAGMLGAEWVRDGKAWLATAERDGQPIYLVRLIAPMNRSGPALSALATRLGFEPAGCVLLYDDVDLPLGTVRLRMRGSSGGHRGLESILDELQTGEVRRIKIGVGRPDRGKPVEFLLAPFPVADRPAVAQACEVAARKALDLVVTAVR